MENPRWQRVRDFSSIRPFLHGLSHLGDGVSSRSAGRPRARTQDSAARTPLPLVGARPAACLYGRQHTPAPLLSGRSTEGAAVLCTQGGHELRDTSDTERHQTKEVTTLSACPASAFVKSSGSCRKEEVPRCKGVLRSSPAGELQSPPNWQPVWLLLSNSRDAHTGSALASGPGSQFFNPKVRYAPL